MADALNMTARGSLNHIPKRLYLTALKLVLLYHMIAEVTKLYTHYIGDWGGTTSTVYKFEAVKDGKVVKSVTKEPMQRHIWR